MITVTKFGGSSVANATQFQKVKNIIMSNKNRRYVVPSAPGRRNSKDYRYAGNIWYLVWKGGGIDGREKFR